MVQEAVTRSAKALPKAANIVMDAFGADTSQPSATYYSAAIAR